MEKMFYHIYNYYVMTHKSIFKKKTLLLMLSHLCWKKTKFNPFLFVIWYQNKSKLPFYHMIFEDGV
jgi:hypothetical protein